MNGKDMFLGFQYIGEDLISEAESRQTVRREHPRRVGRPLVIAAIIALMMLMMGCAVAYANGWFASYFSAKNEAPLSDGQLSFIAAHEQVIRETQVQQDWTVELKSAINDGDTAYIILGVTAPEGLRAGNEIEDGIVKTWMHLGGGADGMGDVITCAAGNVSGKGNYWYQIGSSWTEDGDGKENTCYAVYQLTFQKFDNREECTITEPFAPELAFDIHIDGIFLEYEDEAYRQELLNGKYKGQTDIMFTPEETERLLCRELAAEGTWDFTIHFAESEAGVELLTEAVDTQVYVIKDTGPDIDDYIHTTDTVTLTSFVLKPLSATICYDYDGGVNFTDFGDHTVYAVLKDSGRIELHDRGAGGVGCSLLEADAPIVLEDVDHILLADGTMLPMP